MDYKYQGIILSKRDIAEVDRFYTIFTLEAGKIRTLARGVRNPNAKLAGSLEPVTFSEISISRTKGAGKITGALVIDNFSPIKEDYDALSRVFYIFGIVEKLITNEEKDERIFSLIMEYLITMTSLVHKNNSGEKMDVVTLGFLFKLLELTGYGLNMETCANCAEKLAPEGNFFSASAGGVFCERCVSQKGRRIPIRSGTIKLIRIFIKNKIGNLAKLTVSGDDIRNAKTVAGEMVRWITG